MKQVKQTLIQTIEGKQLQMPDMDEMGKPVIQEDGPKMKDANLKDLLRLLIFTMPADKITMEDSIHAHRFFNQVSAATNGTLPIEDAEHDWIKKKVAEYGPRIFGINAVMVQEALDDFDRLHDPKKK